MVAGLSSSIEPLFCLFAANALVANSRASAGSTVLEIFEKFTCLFPFLSRMRRESFSFRQTLGGRQSYKSRAAVVVIPCACHFLHGAESHPDENGAIDGRQSRIGNRRRRRIGKTCYPVVSRCRRNCDRYIAENQQFDFNRLGF